MHFPIEVLLQGIKTQKSMSCEKRTLDIIYKQFTRKLFRTTMASSTGHGSALTKFVLSNNVCTKNKHETTMHHVVDTKA